MVQKRAWLRGNIEFPFRVVECVRGRKKRISRALNIAITPPSLFGIERRIAYSHKKYHSG